MSVRHAIVNDATLAAVKVVEMSIEKELAQPNGADAMLKSAGVEVAATMRSMMSILRNLQRYTAITEPLRKPPLQAPTSNSMAESKGEQGRAEMEAFCQKLFAQKLQPYPVLDEMIAALDGALATISASCVSLAHGVPAHVRDAIDLYDKEYALLVEVLSDHNLRHKLVNACRTVPELATDAKLTAAMTKVRLLATADNAPVGAPALSSPRAQAEAASAALSSARAHAEAAFDAFRAAHFSEPLTTTARAKRAAPATPAESNGPPAKRVRTNKTAPKPAARPRIRIAHAASETPASPSSPMSSPIDPIYSPVNTPGASEMAMGQ